MNKIATHDSATGERGEGILSWLVTPFAKTQSKTIKEQYEAGCRMFDIRVKLIGNEWKCAHGCWHTQRTATSILEEINNFKDECYVALTYEGNADKAEQFKEYVEGLKTIFKRIHWGGIGIKYGKDSHLFKVSYDYLQPYPSNWPPNRQGFLPLDGKTWHIILPIPYLWKRLYNDVPTFDDKCYTFVDFL